MDARCLRAIALVAIVSGLTDFAPAATYETPNFVVTAPTPEFAQQVGQAAEYYRHHLAIEWLGQPLPGKWSKPCPIRCKVGQIGAGGATTFSFHDGEVFGWHMSIQGSEERILDSVLPHEVSHMIFASYFRQPLPRWADEGAATLVEHESERLRQTKLLDQVIRTSRRIPLAQLLAIKEYPKDMQDVLTLYAEGYSLADFLVQQKGPAGKRLYLQFLGDALKQGWEGAFREHYGFAGVHDVEQKWTGWVMAGSPSLTLPEGELLAQADQPQQEAPQPEALVIRSQNPGATDPQRTPTQLDPLPKLPRPQRQPSESAARLSAPEPVAVAQVTAPPAADLPRREVLSATSPFVTEEQEPRQAVAVAPRPPHPTTVLAPPEVEPLELARDRQPASANSRPAAWLGFPNPGMHDDGIRLGPAP